MSLSGSLHSPVVHRTGSHHLAVDDVARLLEVDPSAGLSEDEVLRRQGTFGPNRITRRRGTPSWLRLGRQFNQPLVFVLLAATAVTAYLGEWVDAVVILSVLVANAVLGVWQETKAEKAIERLFDLIRLEASVLRAGVKQRVAVDALVPGDVVLLQPGDRVPADLRLFRVKGLRIDESCLTGESLPIFKHPNPMAVGTLLADRDNSAFAGTVVTDGHGEGLVWATADRTEVGKIAQLVSSAVDLATPLSRRLAGLCRQILWGVLIVAGLTFGVGVWRGQAPGDMFMAGIALAVGAVPEGLPAAVSIVLAIGVGRMARRGAIIRQLSAVETIGGTTVICCHKTGTLTENQMTVRQIFAGGRFFTVTGGGYDLRGEIQLDGIRVAMEQEPALAACLEAGVLCNDARFTAKTGHSRGLHGDPTEAALLVAGAKGGIHQDLAGQTSPRLDMVPFASKQMCRITLHGRGASRVLYKVGAAERLLEHCGETIDRQGKRVPLDGDATRRAIETMAGQGLRVIALARRNVEDGGNRIDAGQARSELTFLGLQGMIDPPRPEAIEAIRRCQKAGIAVKMITGDHLATARFVAGQMGLGGGADTGGLVCLTGRELENIPDAELSGHAWRTAVFARVSPDQKLRLVRALQSLGHTVAMTGDGVNDAPALKQADIGVAMGKSGTDVARGAADVILTEDNFANLEAAVEEGRNVFNNLTKFIVWILPTNIGEALLILAAMAGGSPLPLLPLHLLWINLTDTVLGLPLAFEEKERDLLLQQPRDFRRAFVNRPLIMRTALVCGMMLAGGYWVFSYEYDGTDGTLPAARTAVVNLVVFVEAAYLLNCRSLTRPFIGSGFASNRWVLAGIAVMGAAQLMLTYSPVVNRFFHTDSIGAGSWGRILVVVTLTFLIVEFEKWCRRRHSRPGAAK
jgi:cation-transporting ATPase F